MQIYQKVAGQKQISPYFRAFLYFYYMSNRLDNQILTK